MSLYGALYSGVSGLTAQSSAMGAISDNVANINTIGYKGTENQFQTLVTKQVSLTKYSAGGVQSVPQAGIDVQGLLSATSSATDLGISGQGFFVVNSASTPGNGDRWAYSRAGSFQMDDDGYLVNSGGFYLQSWPLLPSDGTEGTSNVLVDGVSYMKAYNDENGDEVYINDNIIDSSNLKSVNLSQIGGSATPTRQVILGANLPASDPIYDASTPENGGQQSLSVLTYDSLGNAHNVNFEFTKESANSWGIDAQIPSGATVMTLYSSRETRNDITDDVYASRGQMEFSGIPQNHSSVRITNGAGASAETYVFEFTDDGTNTYVPTAGETLVSVDISSGIVSTLDAVTQLQEAISANVPSGDRFNISGNSIQIEQSLGGDSLVIDASNCLECLQSSANPNQDTGVPSGVYTIPEIDWELKNVAKLDFHSTDPADYEGRGILIGNNIYEFDTDSVINSGNIAVDMTGAISGGVVDLELLLNNLQTAINNNGQDPDRFTSSGKTLEFEQSNTGNDMFMATGDIERLVFNGDLQADYDGFSVTIGGQVYDFTTGPVDQYDVDISGIAWGNGAVTSAEVMNMLKDTINSSDLTNSGQYEVKGNAMVAVDGTIDAAAIGTAVETTTTGVGAAVTGEGKPDGAISPSPLNSSSMVIGDAFSFNAQIDDEQGARAAGVRFNSDGTPKYFNVTSMAVEWANGAQDMTGAGDEGSKVTISLGNTGTPDGLTHLSGDFIPSYIKQDGAKFGNFAGVTVGEDGIVTALFDNGETRPVAMVPLATFVNANGMEGLSGNAWIETDYSGQPTLREAGEGGAGSINAASLESSTVDLGEEFTNMITTQRAYSASARIITTADEMLDELIRIKR